MSLIPYIKDLEQDLWEENVEELCKKEKDINRFFNIVDFLANTSLPGAWPFSGLEDKYYNSSFKLSEAYSTQLPGTYLLECLHLRVVAVWDQE